MADTTKSESDLSALLTFAKSTLAVSQFPLEDNTIAAVPNAMGGRELVSLERFRDELRDAPKRAKGTAEALTLESFIDLTNRHKDESSAIFGDFAGSAPSLLAVIDYHQVAHKGPRFGAHRVRYAFPLSPEWKAWSASDGKVMGQGEWGMFVEDRIADLAAPFDAERSEFERLFQTKIATPAELVQLSRGMALTIESAVKDVRVLQSGEMEVSYEEVHKDGRGEKLVVPGLFIVSIPLFIGSEPSRLIARLRYRKTDGRRLVWLFQFYRADIALRAALEAALERAGEETGLPFFQATPER
jgi:uncharacterized protein YfdQ (DUF2303 family)